MAQTTLLDELDALAPQLLLVLGGTGLGKTTVLRSLIRRGLVDAPDASATTSAEPVVSLIARAHGGVGDAVDRLCAVGLSSVPFWRLPLQALSCGQPSFPPGFDTRLLSEARKAAMIGGDDDDDDAGGADVGREVKRQRVEVEEPEVEDVKEVKETTPAPGASSAPRAPRPPPGPPSRSSARQAASWLPAIYHLK